MKLKTIVFALLVVLSSCANNKTKRMEEKARFVEVVLFNTKEGVDQESAKKSIITLNNFMEKQEGYLSRTTALAEDGRYFDMVYWTDMGSAKLASDKAMKTPEVLEVFGIMEEENMIFKHFEIFNQH